MGAIAHRREQRARHAEQLAKVQVPFPAGDVEDERARRIGGIARMGLAAGQPPEQEAVDGAEGKPARARGRTRPLDMIDQPTDLGRREIRIEHKAGAGRNRRLVPGLPQARAHVGRATVLPYHGIVDRPSAGAVPHDRGLALIGDPDSGDVAGTGSGFGKSFARGCDRRGPDLLGIVLDPAGRRIDLRQFLLRGGNRRQCCIEQDRAGRSGSLVDREKVVGHDAPPLPGAAAAQSLIPRLSHSRLTRRPPACHRFRSGIALPLQVLEIGPGVLQLARRGSVMVVALRHRR